MENTSQGAMALLALSHTPVEQMLYEALLAATEGATVCVTSFSLRRLLELTGLGSYSTIRRARTGLVSKLSIECKHAAGEDDGDEHEHSGSFYLVYSPGEIFRRARRAGVGPSPNVYPTPPA